MLATIAITALVTFVATVAMVFLAVSIGKGFALKDNHIDENAQVDEARASLEAYRAMERDLFATN